MSYPLIVFLSLLGTRIPRGGDDDDDDDNNNDDRSLQISPTSVLDEMSEFETRSVFFIIVVFFALSLAAVVFFASSLNSRSLDVSVPDVEIELDRDLVARLLLLARKRFLSVGRGCATLDGLFLDVVVVRTAEEEEDAAGNVVVVIRSVEADAIGDDVVVVVVVAVA